MDYKKILEGVVDIINTTEKSDIGFANICTYIVENCPELKESDDERIRIEIIDYIKNSTCQVGDETYKSWIAWLEKQGEQKPPVPKWKYKKDNTPLLRDSLILNRYGYVAKSPSGAIVSDVWVIGYDELAKLPKEESERQGEQKPAVKIEPKFKVGQTIIYKGTENIIHTKMTISDIAKGQYWDDNCCIVPISDQDNWELVEQKPAWSEEDKRLLDNRISLIEDIDCTKVEQNWLKSLRPQKQWKPSDYALKLT